MGMLPATPRTLNVARFFVNFVALKFRSRGGIRKKNKCQKRKNVLNPLLALVFARLSFVNAYSYPKVPTHSTNCLLIIMHKIVAWFSFLKGSDLETPWRTGFQHGIWQNCLAPAAISTAHMLIMCRFGAIWIDLLINSLQIICVQTLGASTNLSLQSWGNTPEV